MRSRFNPLFLVSSLGILVLSLLSSYFRAINHNAQYRAESLNHEIAENLRILVDSHTRVLRTIGELDLKDLAGKPEIYLNSADAVLNNYEGFYAINYVDPQGIIRRVHPYERNRAALDKDLNDVVAVREYLRIGRERRVPVMSQLLPTFQGIEAFVMYVPIVSNGEFRGWINGVVDLPMWMNRALEARGTPGLSVRLEWVDHPGSVYRFGPEPEEDGRALTFQLLNQELRLRVQVPDGARAAPPVFQWTIWAAAVALLILIGMLIFSLDGALRAQRSLNRRLHLKNTIVSSLTHDMGTPLTVLSLGLDRLREEPSSPHLWTRVRNSTASLRQMLDSVKLLHAMETGRMELQLESIDLTDAVAAAVDHIAEIANAKEIRFDIDVPPDLPRVVAERSTLCQNVIPNALTNAIKFSPPGGHVAIRARLQGDGVELSVVDRGAGIEPGRLRLLLDDGALTAQSGTQGERGSGLGLLQVKTFMSIYGGSLNIESRVGQDHGTELQLRFRRS